MQSFYIHIILFYLIAFDRINETQIENIKTQV